MSVRTVSNDLSVVRMQPVTTFQQLPVVLVRSGFFLFLEGKDLAHVSSVNREWKAIVDASHFSMLKIAARAHVEVEKMKREAELARAAIRSELRQTMSWWFCLSHEI